MSGFDEFIALDWSGGAGRYLGIAVARCRPGAAAPRLVTPEGGRWTRTLVATWLDREVRRGKRLLIGLDLAFGMPFEAGLGYAGAGTAADVFALWTAIETASAAAPDFGCAPLLADPRFASLYWSRGPQPRGWRLRQRRAEIACAAATGTRPECVFKLIGPKQVGKASLTGIRVLNDVRGRNRDRVAVWPFEDVGGRSALVEVYPTLFRQHAGHGLAKLRTREELNRALKRLGSRGVADTRFTDHDTDALVSAAGLRHFTTRLGHGLERPADAGIRREGWIFGVPLPAHPRGQAKAA